MSARKWPQRLKKRTTLTRSTTSLVARRKSAAVNCAARASFHVLVPGRLPEHRDGECDTAAHLACFLSKPTYRSWVGSSAGHTLKLKTSSLSSPVFTTALPLEAAATGKLQQLENYSSLPCCSVLRCCCSHETEKDGHVCSRLPLCIGVVMEGLSSILDASTCLHGCAEQAAGNTTPEKIKNV